MDYSQIRNTDEDPSRNGPLVPGQDNLFFKMFPDNIKYTFNSPIHPKSQFPTPYSSNLLDSTRTNNNNNNTFITYNYDPDSSFLERNSYLYSNNKTIQQDTSLSKFNQNADINKTKNANKNISMEDTQFSLTESTNAKQQLRSKINNMNRLNVPNVNTNDENNNNNNNNNNIHTDFLLPSPVQLGEFLYDSPARIGLFHNTPARSPLKFVTEEFFTDNNNNSNKSGKHGNQQNGSASFNLSHLFNSTGNMDSTNNNSNNNTLIDIWDRLSNNTRTPLRKIDINLSLNNGQPLTNSNSLSPLKKFSVSLTPYGRRILNDLGTPFNHTPNLNVNNNNIVTSSNIKTYLFGASSNSAMIDYQRARKDTIFDTPHEINSTMKNNLMIMSPSKLASFDIPFKSPKLIMTPKNDKRSINKNGLSDCQIPKLKITNSSIIHDNKQLDSIDQKLDTGADVDASSPTTIQLNSSVTKSLTKSDRNCYTKLSDRIPLLSRNMSPLQRVSLDMSFSPTPRSTLHTPIDIKTQFPSENRSGSNKLTFLPVPDLPKMGSFKSERTASSLTNNDISIDSQDSQTSLSKLPSITTFSSTKILPPQVQPKKGMIKKKKMTKVKKPKFQIFVSSIHKFNDPNSSVPVTSLKHGNHNRHSTNHKANKRKKK